MQYFSLGIFNKKLREKQLIMFQKHNFDLAIYKEEKQSGAGLVWFNKVPRVVPANLIINTVVYLCNHMWSLTIEFSSGSLIKLFVPK